MFTIYPKAVKVFKAVASSEEVVQNVDNQTAEKSATVETQVAQSSQQAKKKLAVTAAKSPKKKNKFAAVMNDVFKGLNVSTVKNERLSPYAVYTVIDKESSKVISNATKNGWVAKKSVGASYEAVLTNERFPGTKVLVTIPNDPEDIEIFYPNADDSLSDYAYVEVEIGAVKSSISATVTAAVKSTDRGSSYYAEALKAAKAVISKGKYSNATMGYDVTFDKKTLQITFTKKPKMASVVVSQRRQEMRPIIPIVLLKALEELGYKLNHSKRVKAKYDEESKTYVASTFKKGATFAEQRKQICAELGIKESELADYIDNANDLTEIKRAADKLGYNMSISRPDSLTRNKTLLKSKLGLMSASAVSESSVMTAARAKAKTTKKPTKALIGLFYSYYKRPLNYLFSILSKPRKTADQKATVKSLMAGLRKAETKFQKENKFTDSIVDLLINQRSLKLGKLEASFDAATASAVTEVQAGGEVGVFYNMHKRPLGYLFALLKSPKLEKSDKKIVDSLVKGLRKAETNFMKTNGVDKSILDKLLKQRKLKLEA